MAQLDYIDAQSVHVTLTRDDLVQLFREHEIVEPRATYEGLTRSGRPTERLVPNTVALVIRLDLERPAACL